MSKDLLTEMFSRQEQFQNRVIRERGLDDWSEAQWVDKVADAVDEEAAELRDSTGWKWWTNDEGLDRDNAVEELVDIQCFVMTALLSLDVSAEQFFERYMEKMEENDARQDGESRDGYSSQETKG